MKKAISVILVIAVLMSGLCFAAGAAQTQYYRDGSFEFYIENNQAYISYVYSCSTGTLAIPYRLCCDDTHKLSAPHAAGFTDDDNEVPDYFGQEYVFTVGLLSGALDDVADNVKSISIPRYLTEFDVSDIASLYNLESISVEADNTVYSSENGSLYNKDKTQFLIHPAESSDSTIASSVTSFRNGAFSGSGKITGVSIPAGVTTIPDSCFENCSALTTLDLSASSVKTISTYAFFNSGLKSVILGNSIQTISSFAFYNSKSLETVMIPEQASDVKIASGAFHGCSIKNITLYRNVSDIASKALGYYYDDDYAENKLSDFTITGYKYTADRSATTAAYDYAAANSFTFIPLDNNYSVTYTYNNYKNYRTGMYLYQGSDLKYSVVSNTGVFTINGVNPGKYNVYFLSQFGVLLSAGSVTVTTAQEQYSYKLNTYTAIGDVTRDGSINVQDVAKLLQEGIYGKANADYDIDLDGVVGMSDISVVLYLRNYGKNADIIDSSFDTPILPMN